MLPEFDAIEESLDNHERMAGRLLDGPVEVEKLQRLSEAGRELVFRRIAGRFSWPASGVGDDLAVWIVNRNHDTAGHHPLGAVTKAEPGDDLRSQTSLREIRMAEVEVFQTEAERLVWRIVIGGRPGGRSGRLVCR